MRAGRLVALAALLALACGGAREYESTGDVIAVDAPGRHVTIRHEDIPGLMGPMTMRFDAASAEMLAGVTPGARVRFRVRRSGEALVVTHLEPLAGAAPPPAPPPGAPGPGVHDHTPHHGGVVGMTGDLHLEALAAADGMVRVYLTDFWRYPLPVADVTGSVTLELPTGDEELRLAATADSLVARATPLAVPEVAAHFELTVAGRPVEMDFLLPIAAGRAGAAAVPVRGCVPLEPAPGGGARHPRCALDFGTGVTVIAGTPDGTRVLVAAVDAGVSVWELPAGRLVLGFAHPPPIAVPGPEGLGRHPESTNAMAIGPDGREALVTAEGRLLRYEIAGGRIVRELAAPRGILRAVAWSPDGTRLLVTAFYDDAAHLLRAEDGSEARRLPVEREGAAVAFSPDGARAAVASDTGSIALWDLAGDAPPRMLLGEHGPVQGIVFAGDRVIAAGDDGIVHLWDVRTGASAGEVPLGTRLARLALAPDGRRFASSGADGHVWVHELPGGAVVETLAWHQHQPLGLAWAGDVLVSGDTAGRVVLWDVGG